MHCDESNKVSSHTIRRFSLSARLGAPPPEVDIHQHHEVTALSR
jgi:hypothetical protein